MWIVSRQTQQWARAAVVAALAAAGMLGPRLVWPAAAGVLLVNDTYKVVRFNAQTGALIDTLVPQGTGGLQFVTSMAWGPDGNLYVGDSGSSSILRFNGSTGAFIDTFVPAASGGLDYPASIAFGSDGNLYVSNVIRPGFNSGPVLRFNGATGAFMGEFIPAGTGGLGSPRQVLFLPPAAPTGLTASVVSYSQINLTCTDNSDDETAFAIWRQTGGGAWARAGLVPPNSTSFSDTGLSGSTAYTYQVRAINSVGASTWSNQAGATTWPPPPAPPTGLAAVPVGNNQVNLTWTVPNSNQTAVSVWRRTCTSTYARIAVLAPTAAAYTDAGLSPNTSYIYRVRTANSYYASAWSGEVIATTGP